MAINVHHPLYDEQLPDWTQMRDTHKGERAVKEKGFLYLSATAGMIADGAHTNAASVGGMVYDAYRKRARFPGLVASAVETNIGVMHNKSPTIKLPKAIEPMLKRATSRGESLEMLMRRINEEQLTMSRLGLLLEIVVKPAKTVLGKLTPASVTPMIALYRAEDIINWNDGTEIDQDPDALKLVVLCETSYEADASNYSWTLVEKYRELSLGDPDEPEDVTAGNVGNYIVTLHTQTGPNKGVDDPIRPEIKGRALQQIPFVFINVKDIVPEPCEPLLIDLSNLTLSMYRKDADYQQALFMQGQDTLVVTGGDSDKVYRTGAGACITPPVGGDAKYIGVDSQGLAEMRTSLENDFNRAKEHTGSLTDETSRERQSGEALRVRVAGKTASLNQIANTGAAALEYLLKIAAEWMGANPEEVSVEPNLDFVDDSIAIPDATALWTAMTMGLPLPQEDYYALLQSKGIANAERTFEDAIALIDEEKAKGMMPAPSMNPDGPVPGDPNAPAPNAKPA